MSIEIITGGMMCGKSEEVLRRAKRGRIAGLAVQIFTPDIDRRLAEGNIASRDERRDKCTVVPAENAEYILSLLDDGTGMVVIDEAQFFRPRYELIEHKGQQLLVESYPIVDVVQTMADRGVQVLIAGLDMDSDRKPFGPMPYLMAIATEVSKMNAVCENCAADAEYSFANFAKSEQIVVGDSEYLSLCRLCYLAFSTVSDGNGKILKEILETIFADKKQEKKPEQKQEKKPALGKIIPFKRKE